MSLRARGRRLAIRIPLVIALVAAGSPAQLRGEDPDGQANSWEELTATPEGSRVRIGLRDGSEVTGRIVVVRTDAVVLDDLQTGPNGVRTPPGSGSVQDGFRFDRADVASVEVLSRARAFPGVATSFDQLSVLAAPGQKVSVTDSSGARFTGTIAALSPSTLSVTVGREVRSLRQADIATVRQRRDDSLGNGALWGLGAGMTVGMVTCGRCHIGPGLMLGALFGGAGAGIGVGIDALVRGEMVIYRGRGASTTRVSIAPRLAPSHQGAALSIRF
jgi:hypothetical protein